MHIILSTYYMLVPMIASFKIDIPNITLLKIIRKVYIIYINKYGCKIFI